MGNIVNTVKRFSSNDATAIPVQRCSNLSIGTSRLDKCTCIGNGISMTVETALASKGGSINGCKDFWDVANEEMHMTPGSTSIKGCLGDIDLLTPPMVHTRPSGSDEGNNERETPNGTAHNDARELGCVDHSENSGLIYSQSAGHMFHNLEGGSTGTPRSLMLDISKESLCKVSLEGNSFRNPKLADAVESSPAADARKGKELLYRVSPADGLFDSTVCEELADGALDSCYKSNAEVSLDGQSHEQSKQHKSVNYDVVPIEVIAPCANLDVSNPKSSLKGRAKRKRIAKVSSQMLVPKENTGILVPSDQICVETPTSELVERSSGDEILQGTPRSRMTKTPLSYVHHSPLTRSKSKALSVATSQCVKMKRSKVHRSPLTRSKSKSLSIATPESVKIKQSRSGRLIVPRLDPGSQNITYGPDGCICGITNLEASFPQGISSEPPSKRRMSQRLSPDLYRLLTF